MKIHAISFIIEMFIVPRELLFLFFAPSSLPVYLVNKDKLWLMKVWGMRYGLTWLVQSTRVGTCGKGLKGCDHKLGKGDTVYL